MKQTINNRPGIFNVNKPSGMTSRQLVDRVQDRFPGNKAGHAGTLDRAASGVLPVLLNEATKLVPYIHREEKTYRATIRFDYDSESYDMDREVRSVVAGPEINWHQVERVLKGYQGRINQVPPRYSALRVDGQRAYERVEAGEDPELSAREVDVESIKIDEFTYPILRLNITCGKGFYVRALVRDLSADLNQDGGVLSDLIRTQYGFFSLENSVTVEENWSSGWYPPVRAVDSYLKLVLDENELEILRNGGWIPRESHEDSWAAALDHRGNLFAMVTPKRHDGQPVWQPRRVMNRPDLETPTQQEVR